MLFLETIDLGKKIDVSLPEDLLDRYKQLMTPYARQVFQTSYFIKCKLAAYLRLDAFEIIYNSFGKPFLKSQNEVYQFSMAHHGNWVVLVYHENQPVGVDLMNRTQVHLMNLTNCAFFSPEEQVYAKDIPSFLTVWMAKEAYSKLIGTGLHEDLNCLNLLPYLHDSTLTYQGIKFEYTYFGDYILCIARF